MKARNRILFMKRTIRSYERAVTDKAYRRRLSKKQGIGLWPDDDIIIHYSRHAQTLKQCLNFYKNSIGGFATEALVAGAILKNTKTDTSIVANAVEDKNYEPAI